MGMKYVLSILLSFFLWYGGLHPSTILANPLDQEKIKLLEAIEKISQEYNVYFTFDMTLVAKVEVQYERALYSSAEDAISRILRGTGLKYRFYDKRFVILYKDDASGLESLKEMSKHLNGLISEGEKEIDATEKSNTLATTRLTTPSVFKKTIHSVAFSVEGKVTNRDGEPLVGVTIQVKGSVKATTTNDRGYFTLSDIETNAVLMFTYVGYEMQEVRVEGRANIGVTMVTVAQALSEVVVVGYGTQKKESIVGSIARIGGEDLQQRGGVTNLSSSLAGQIPGVTVIQSTGEPGRDDPDILIRGMSSWNGSQPLILVDGIERAMNDVNVNDVESISVLKDASATAVFGVKGANGVILVTTKRGTLGKPRLSFSAHRLVKSVSKVPKLMDSYTARQFRNVAVEREVSSTPTAWQYITPGEVLEFYKKPQIEPYSYLFPNEDWQKLVMKDYATSSQADMSLSGGTENVKYFTSLGYFHDGDMLNSHYNKEQGYDPGFSYNRFNFRGNLDFKLTKTTIFSANVSGYIGNQKASGATFSGTVGPGNNGINYQHLYRGVYGLAPDAFPAKYPDGFYGINIGNLNYPNPLVSLLEAGAVFYNRNYMGTDLKLEQKLDVITEGLSVSGRVAFDKYVTSNGPNINAGTGGTASTEYMDPFLILAATTREDSLKAIQIMGTSGSTGKNEFDYVLTPWSMTKETVVNSSLQRNLYYQINLNYSRSFNKHSVTGLVMFNRQETATGSEFAHFQEDWVGRVTYNYDGRYFTEFNGAYNGSEKFAPKYRFGFFPSAALGWMISNESFMRQFSWIDNLKFRGSIGAVGSDRGIPRWGYIGSWLFPGTAGYFIGVDGIAQQLSPYSNYAEGIIANPDIRWETAIKENVGIDFSALNGKITFTGDVFREGRKNIFMTADKRSIPITFGAPAVPANIGETETHGYEFTLGYNKRNSDGFDYNVSLSMTKALDKVVKYEDPELLDSYQKVVGFQIGQGKSQVSHGYLNTWDDVYGSAKGISNMTVRMPGDWDLIDYNGDGVVDNFDVVPYGFTNRPRNSYNATLGASYKGLSLMVQFFAVTGVNLTANPYTPAALPWTTVSEELADYWTPGNPNAFYKGPRITTTSSDGQFGRYDASYIRLKTAVLAYDFTGKWIRDLGVSNARIALTGNNLIFWSDFPVDSETGYSLTSSYPTYRQFDLSLNITF